MASLKGTSTAQTKRVAGARRSSLVDPRKSTKSEPKTSLHAARTAKEIALARLRQLEVELKEGTVLPADEVERRWSDILRRVRAGVMASTSRIRSQLPHLTAHDCDIIDRELRDALAALADGDPP